MKITKSDLDESGNLVTQVAVGVMVKLCTHESGRTSSLKEKAEYALSCGMVFGQAILDMLEMAKNEP